VPLFPTCQLEDRGDHEIVQQEDGVRVLRRKTFSSIPIPRSHLLQDRASWREHYAPRLDPTNPARFPRDWQERVRRWREPDRELPVFLFAGSLYGWLRNWVGLEQLSYTVYDHPAWFEEMITTVADCILGTLERALATGVQFDGAGMWEDMCYREGPLLSPGHVRQYMVPHYRRITDLLARHGVDIVWLDCDGRIDKLLPLWLEAGVNCMLPIEVGTWNADPVALRREYGQELRMLGGFDKRILAGSREQITREVHRLAPLVEEGGYVPFCDHRVPPDVPLASYLHYLRQARAVWGHDTSLRPLLARQDS
jgi:uroporphyrinogen decarboxylase